MSGSEEESGFGRSAGLLSAGVGTAGLLTYVFFSLASHNLEATAYGEIVVLWSAVFVTISVIHRPVEQYISRSVAEHRVRGEAIGPTLRAAAIMQGSIALGFAAIALVLRAPLEDELLSGNETLYWIYVSSVVCFAASFFARGFLAGSGRFVVLAGLLVTESASRTAFALALALGITSGENAVALGIVAAPLVSLLVVPLAFVHRAAVNANAPPARTAGLAGGGAFAGAVFWIMLSEQTFLNGGPLLIRAFDGAAAAGYIFNVLMLARAPLLVFQGVAVSLLPHLTRLRSRGGDAGARFKLSVGQTLRAVVAFTALVAVIVAVAGPELMQIAFGERFEYDRLGLLLVTGAMGLYLAATTLNQAALAQGQVRRAALVWSGCAAGFLIWSVLPFIGDTDLRIETGFALAALALCAALWRVYSSPAAESPQLSEADISVVLVDEAG